MNNTFYDVHDELYHHAKFGEDRTTRAGCRCENVVFVFLVFCHAPSPERHAFEGYIVRTRIALPFIGQFRRGFDGFFRKWLHFQTRYIVLTFIARWRHNFREIAVKNCEKSKNRRDLEKILTQYFRAETVDVHLYKKKICARRSLALTASVKFRISSPKTARNEQVCAHQNSYRK